MKIVLTASELADQTLRHKRAVTELFPTKFFASEGEAKQFIDLIADSQAGSPMIPSIRAWMERFDRLLTAQNEYEVVRGDAINQGALLASLRQGVASKTQKIRDAKERLGILENDLLPQVESFLQSSLTDTSQNQHVFVAQFAQRFGCIEAINWIKKVGLPALEAEKLKADDALSVFLTKIQSPA